MRKAHRLPGVPFADGAVERRDLPRRVVDQGRHDLAHQFLVFERHVAQLLAVQHNKFRLGATSPFSKMRLPPKIGANP